MQDRLHRPRNPNDNGGGHLEDESARDPSYTGAEEVPACEVVRDEPYSDRQRGENNEVDKLKRRLANKFDGSQLLQQCCERRSKGDGSVAQLALGRDVRARPAPDYIRSRLHPPR